ncbi:unnamed protein product [Moneuplotes crassus]|uniref:Uncharacterized protein n=1 Tax=Euplotes crassus TaxID=5936 RepID=A0AAD2D6N6_EUPCR|nr:unnamed protein product [Moneuplotes crassus]
MKNMSCWDKEYKDDLKEEDIYQFKELFTHFYPDAYGRVSVKHLKSLLNCIDLNPTDTDVKKLLIPKADPENTGKFSLDDFMNLINSTEIPKDTPASFCEALEEIDHEGNGKIKIEDAQQLFMVAGETFTQDEFLEMITLGDLENTGFIDIKQLVKAVMGRC